METITINTYDLENRFGVNTERANILLKYVEQTAVNEGYAVQFTKSIYVDQFSEDFVAKCVENYYF